MDLVQEVISFARDYVNGNQTQERKHKIAAAYRNLFGESMNVGCGTCYVESIFKIIRKMEQKPRIYTIRPGVVLQSFGDASKTITNKTQDKDLEKIGMTFDQLCEWHLRNNPGCIRYFSAPSPDEIQRRLLGDRAEIKKADEPNEDGLTFLSMPGETAFKLPEPEIIKPLTEGKKEIKEEIKKPEFPGDRMESNIDPSAKKKGRKAKK